jgi:hypothetical protein
MKNGWSENLWEQFCGRRVLSPDIRAVVLNVCTVVMAINAKNLNFFVQV